MRPLRLALCGLLAGLTLCQAGRAHAATFTVNPTQVLLSARVTSALVSLRNESQDPLRFQLTLQAWDQRPGGEMALTPTKDVIFFPQLLTLGAREERKVRVALASPAIAGGSERTYRLFVEELPPSQAEPRPQGVKVLTKMGIPIFVQPPVPAAKPLLQELAASAGRFAFTAANAGNAHFVPDLIRVDGVGADGQAVFSETINGWYILAGGTRRYEIEIPVASCAGTTGLVVTLQLGTQAVTQRLDTPGGSCKAPLQP